MAYGSNTEYREKEVRDVFHYFFEGTGAPDNSERLLDLFGSEVKPHIYDDGCSVKFEFGKIIIEQRSGKEFYHDGSEQSYKEFSLELITAEEYMNARGEGIFEKPRFLNYSNEWFENLEDFFFVRTKSIYERYDIYARDLLGLGFVKLTLDC